MYVANLSCPEMCVVLAQNSLKLAPKLFIEYKIKAYASSKENIKFPFAEKGDRHPINRVTLLRLYSVSFYFKIDFTQLITSRSYVVGN